MQDPHLPPGTAAMGTCWISCTLQPICPGNLDPDPAGTTPYPKTLAAASAKKKLTQLPETETNGVQTARQAIVLCPSCEKSASFFAPGDCPAWQGSAGFLTVVQRHSMPKTGNGRAGAC